jgi:hypothetical protein
MTTVVDELPPLLCNDCGVNILEIKEYYMVSNRCWKRSGMKEGFLCIGCLEHRLGEKLKAINFKDCPLNWRNIIFPDGASSRLISRMLSGGKRSKWIKKLIQAYDEALAGKNDMIENLTLVRIDGGGRDEQS